MPHAEVRFAPTTDYSRRPTDGELRLFNDFCDHQFVCKDCDLHNRYFCDRGHYLAQYIAARLYSSNGKTFSSRDRDHDVPVQVEIPIGCEAVRTLLKIIERRNREVKRQSSPSADQSYDRTYYIPRRPVAKSPPRPAPVIIAAPTQYISAPTYSVPKSKDQTNIPLQYPSPLPTPARTRRRYSTATTPAAFTYYAAPEMAPAPESYGRYYR